MFENLINDKSNKKNPAIAGFFVDILFKYVT